MDFSYSVDMIRLRGRVKKRDVERVFGVLMEWKQIQYYQKFSFKEYRHNWKVKTKDWGAGFYVAFQHNSKTRDITDTSSDLVIEYNPNKVGHDDFFFSAIYQHLLLASSDGIEIVSCDVACDIQGLNISNVLYDKQVKREVMEFRRGGDDMTIYIGQGYGRTKIYNKIKENKDAIQKAQKRLETQQKRLETHPHEVSDPVVIPKNVVPEGVKDWTRYEITLEVKRSLTLTALDGLNGFDFTMPQIWMMPKQDESYLEELNDTDQAIMFALVHGYPFEKLSRRVKTKFREILKEKSEVKIDKKNILSALEEYTKKLVGVQFTEIELPEFDGENSYGWLVDASETAS